jgi:hypothetical protein
VEFLSDEQVARCRRFRPEVSVAELEQFFRLDAKAPKTPAGKRRPATKPGWAVQRGTVRMLGTFLAAPEDLVDRRRPGRAGPADRLELAGADGAGEGEQLRTSCSVGRTKDQS